MFNIMCHSNITGSLRDKNACAMKHSVRFEIRVHCIAKLEGQFALISPTLTYDVSQRHIRAIVSHFNNPTQS